LVEAIIPNRLALSANLSGDDSTATWCKIASRSSVKSCACFFNSCSTNASWARAVLTTSKASKPAVKIVARKTPNVLSPAT
jgi:hypothetical protein